ncbi:MAG: hypothetical protein K0S65_6544 [Labilithrix sp.]|nr:hypothetical protein [Labilithrix sp.]
MKVMGKRRGVTAWPILLGLFGLVAGSCAGNYGFMVSAPPIETTARLVEESPDVARALGAPVKVSLATTRTLRRSPLGVITGKDHVTLLTRAKGTGGEATLRVSAMNLDRQGWSGSFSLEAEGTQVLRDGVYVTEGGGRILAGGFAPTGEAIVKSKE